MGKTKSLWRNIEVTFSNCPCSSSLGLVNCPSMVLCCSTDQCLKLTPKAKHHKQVQHKRGAKQNKAPPSRDCQRVHRLPSKAQVRVGC